VTGLSSKDIVTTTGRRVACERSSAISASPRYENVSHLGGEGAGLHVAALLELEEVAAVSENRSLREPLQESLRHGSSFYGSEDRTASAVARSRRYGSGVEGSSLSISRASRWPSKMASATITRGATQSPAR